MDKLKRYKQFKRSAEQAYAWCMDNPCLTNGQVAFELQNLIKIYDKFIEEEKNG